MKASIPAYSQAALCFLLLAAKIPVQGQPSIYETNVFVQTVAGSGFYGYMDGQGLETFFEGPSSVVVDQMTNVFVKDGRRIRKIDRDARVTTFAGGGQASQGYGTNVNLGLISGITMDPNGVIYFPDLGKIKKVTPDGYVTWFAGGDPGYRDGTVSNAQFSASVALACDGAGNIFVADTDNHRIRKIDANGVVSTIAGSGTAGFADGNGIFTAFYSPRGIVVDLARNIYIADTLNYRIRKISPQGTVTTVAGNGQDLYRDGIGTNAFLGPVASITIDTRGNIFFAHRAAIRKISPQQLVTTVAGYSLGYADGSGSNAKFRLDAGLAAGPLSEIQVGDAGNYRVRRILLSSPPDAPPTELSASLYPGVNISGMVGRFYRIESAEAVDSNDWRALTTISLPSNPYLWFDSSATNAVRRFYRAVLLP
jgi:hypothetical protein